MLAELGEEIEDSEVMEMIEEAKLGKNVPITYNEFVQILSISTRDIVNLTEKYITK